MTKINDLTVNQMLGLADGVKDARKHPTDHIELKTWGGFQIVDLKVKGVEKIDPTTITELSKASIRLLEEGHKTENQEIINAAVKLMAETARLKAVRTELFKEGKIKGTEEGLWAPVQKVLTYLSQPWASVTKAMAKALEKTFGKKEFVDMSQIKDAIAKAISEDKYEAKNFLGSIYLFNESKPNEAKKLLSDLIKDPSIPKHVVQELIAFAPSIRGTEGYTTVSVGVEKKAQKAEIKQKAAEEKLQAEREAAELEKIETGKKLEAAQQEAQRKIQEAVEAAQQETQKKLQEVMNKQKESEAQAAKDLQEAVKAVLGDTNKIIDELNADLQKKQDQLEGAARKEKETLSQTIEDLQDQIKTHQKERNLLQDQIKDLSKPKEEPIILPIREEPKPRGDFLKPFEVMEGYAGRVEEGVLPQIAQLENDIRVRAQPVFDGDILDLFPGYRTDVNRLGEIRNGLDAKMNTIADFVHPKVGNEKVSVMEQAKDSANLKVFQEYILGTAINPFADYDLDLQRNNTTKLLRLKVIEKALPKPVKPPVILDPDGLAEATRLLDKTNSKMAKLKITNPSHDEQVKELEKRQKKDRAAFRAWMLDKKINETDEKSGKPLLDHFIEQQQKVMATLVAKGQPTAADNFMSAVNVVKESVGGVLGKAGGVIHGLVDEAGRKKALEQEISDMSLGFAVNGTLLNLLPDHGKSTVKQLEQSIVQLKEVVPQLKKMMNKNEQLDVASQGKLLETVLLDSARLSDYKLNKIVNAYNQNLITFQVTATPQIDADKEWMALFEGQVGPSSNTFKDHFKLYINDNRNNLTQNNLDAARRHMARLNPFFGTTKLPIDSANGNVNREFFGELFKLNNPDFESWVSDKKKIVKDSFGKDVAVYEIRKPAPATISDLKSKIDEMAEAYCAGVDTKKISEAFVSDLKGVKDPAVWEDRYNNIKHIFDQLKPTLGGRAKTFFLAELPTSLKIDFSPKGALENFAQTLRSRHVNVSADYKFGPSRNGLVQLVGVAMLADIKTRARNHYAQSIATLGRNLLPVTLTAGSIGPGGDFIQLFPQKTGLQEVDLNEDQLEVAFRTLERTFRNLGNVKIDIVQYITAGTAAQVDLSNSLQKQRALQMLEMLLDPNFDVTVANPKWGPRNPIDGSYALMSFNDRKYPMPYATAKLPFPSKFKFEA